MSRVCRESILMLAVCITIAVLASVRGLAADPPPGKPPAAPQGADDDAAGDLARKAEIMNSARWRRAIFELGEWLSSQQIYTAEQVRRIKLDFNRRVAGMSSYEVEYLLEDLDAKFKILDTPEAQDARAWVGQYLSAMSDQKRAETLKDVPDVVKMSAGQLQQEIKVIEDKRTQLQRQQAAFDQSRQLLAQRADDARRSTAAASRAAAAQMNAGGASFSPYRGQGQGQPPFADAHTGTGMSIGVGPFGAYVGFSLGNL